MEKLYKWFIVVIGFLLLPPVSNFINGFFEGFFGYELNTLEISMWMVSILVLIVGVKELINKKNRR